MGRYDGYKLQLRPRKGVIMRGRLHDGMILGQKLYILQIGCYAFSGLACI